MTWISKGKSSSIALWGLNVDDYMVSTYIHRICILLTLNLRKTFMMPAGAFEGLLMVFKAVLRVSSQFFSSSSKVFACWAIWEDESAEAKLDRVPM